MYRLRLT